MSIYLNDDIAHFDWQAALPLLSDQRREQCLKFKHEQGRKTCAAAYLLLCEGLKKEVSPGTLSINTRRQHPIFNHFPTDNYTNWQWWSILHNSRPMILDNTEENFRPVIGMIDNVERSHKLGIMIVIL